MVVSLLGLPVQSFTANAFTTGATASNILALSIGREHTISRVQRARGAFDWSVSDNGFGGVEIEVFCAGAHSSVAKSASLVGIGRRNVFDIATTQDDQPCAFDLGVLEERLKANVGKKGSIVVSSFGEVNTGGFTPDTEIIRALCDKYDAWLHIDAGMSSSLVNPDL
jgi:glutamate/tyrosine decarboxylase-like PLP-dependent enzyme